MNHVSKYVEAVQFVFSWLQQILADTCLHWILHNSNILHTDLIIW